MATRIYIKILKHLDKKGMGRYHNIEILPKYRYINLSKYCYVHKKDEDYQGVIEELERQNYIETNRNKLYYLDNNLVGIKEWFPETKFKDYDNKLKAKITLKGVKYLQEQGKSNLQNTFFRNSTKNLLIAFLMLILGILGYFEKNKEQHIQEVNEIEKLDRQLNDTIPVKTIKDNKKNIQSNGTK